MGGGDLNFKKSWHPSTFANLKKVWEAEQTNVKEQQKLAELRKEKEAEREIEDMRRLQQAAGLISKQSDRVEWMYSGANANSTSMTEEFLLGRRRFGQEGTKDFSSSETTDVAKSLGAIDQRRSGPLSASQRANTSSEMEAKIREDPLFAIKRREQEIVQDIVKNPFRRALWSQRLNTSTRSVAERPAETPLRPSTRALPRSDERSSERVRGEGQSPRSYSSTLNRDRCEDAEGKRYERHSPYNRRSSRSRSPDRSDSSRHRYRR